MPYRKKDGEDTWHWCRNCSKWPASGYKEEQSKPLSGPLCNECKAKDQSGTCAK